MKLCKDCVYYQLNDEFEHYPGEFDLCLRPRVARVSYVTGDHIPDKRKRYVEIERAFNSRCGAEAKFFQPKHSVEQTTVVEVAPQSFIARVKTFFTRD